MADAPRMFGAVFLAAWSDDRCAWHDYDFEGAAYEQGVYVGRIQPDGTVLDPVGIQLAEGRSQYIGASCNGENVLIVSQNILGGGAVLSSVYARLVNSQGVLLNSAYTCSGEQPAVASDGSGWLMVFARLDSVAWNRTDYVVVTGLSSCEIPDGKTAPVRLLRPRCRGDVSIMVHKP